MSGVFNVPVQQGPINDFRLGSPYYPGTICVFLYKARAPTISYDEIVQALKTHADVDKNDIAHLSNLGTNRVWFLRLTNEAKEKLYNKLHSFSFNIEDRSVKFILKHLDKIYLLGYLHQAPAHFTHSDVENTIRCFPTLHSVVAVRPLGNGKWRLLFSPQESEYIPHFVDVYYSRNESHAVLLELTGRVTPSSFCGAYDYRVCRCQLSAMADRVRQRRSAARRGRSSTRQE